MIDFLCNLCGSSNRVARELLDREKPSCSACGANVRTRGLLHALSLELFGVSLPLPDFPRAKSLRGVGLSDSRAYADPLAEKFDYRNTFYSREPRLDLTNPASERSEQYDFLISSEIFEHIVAPVEAAFQNAFRLLKPHGVMLLTVPYSVGPATIEHFAGLHEFGLAQVGGRTLLVNRTPSGEVQVFDDLVFHLSGNGPALEMREFSETGLRTALRAAGFCEVRVYSEDYLPFGIVRAESWSLPVAARKAPFALGFDAARDVLGQWAALRKSFRELGGEFWVRLGFKLGLIRRGQYFTARGNGFQPAATDSDNDEKQTQQ